MQYRQGKERGNFAEDTAAKFLLQRGLNVFGDAFHRFQGDVTDKAVADDDIQFFLEEDIIAFRRNRSS